VTPAADPTPDDLSAVRSLLAPLDPVPDPTLAREDVLAARASVGLARAKAAPAPRRRGLVAAGAVAALSVATLLALVLLPGDGRSTETIDLATGPGAQAINAAYQATTKAGTARGVLTVDHGNSNVTATGVGDLDTGAGRAEVDLVEPGSSRGVHVTVIRTADAIYAKLPVGANPLSATAQWVSVDAATLARLAQMAAGDLGAQVTGSPVDALSYLKAISGDVQVVGPDEVRGEPTTRYRGAIDAKKVAEQLPAQLQAHAAQATGQVGQTIPADLWLDAEGRLRKLVLTTEEAPGRTPTTLTIVLWDFGAPVDATPPPADQVVDVGGLLGGFLNGTRRP
jgi:hypothetical protein